MVTRHTMQPRRAASGAILAGACLAPRLTSASLVGNEFCHSDRILVRQKQKGRAVWVNVPSHQNRFWPVQRRAFVQMSQFQPLL
jgi:hypothetical protein